MNNSKSDSYAGAGVDITAGYESVERITPHIKSTCRPGVLGGFGGFGALFEPDLSNMKRPVAVSGTDGVGTKLKIAFLMDKHDTIGIDCVAMCVNDIVCTGAPPLFFLDYLAMGKNMPARTEQIVSGVAEGCRQAGCALIGGETAEHPGMMPDDEYDIAGFSVGFVDYDDIIDGKLTKPGDAIIGLASSGLHSNGFSLVRKVFADDLNNLGAYMPELGCTLGEELLRPTKIYVKSLLHVISQFGKDIKGISNITGGGYYENIPRMLPEGIRARINVAGIPHNPIFSVLAKKGSIPARDMYNTFNMGVGAAIILSGDKADAIAASLLERGETPVCIGICEKGAKGVDLV
ncbi:MAG: phosphoribosylformylglycinamidine cyclo-ligase [Oscillospiraceae bacterium]|jgi:phosphoribosylformylglycinamidine cyclo-ligase|nr:phosphoribosylformylglycinamidine cyclo-ligase [Oscillospiraceae bacterium]